VMPVMAEERFHATLMAADSHLGRSGNRPGIIPDRRGIFHPRPRQSARCQGRSVPAIFGFVRGMSENKCGAAAGTNRRTPTGYSAV
jgi:hypothetical protein